MLTAPVWVRRNDVTVNSHSLRKYHFGRSNFSVADRAAVNAKSPAARPGFPLLEMCVCYFAMRSCESCVPICWNVVTIWFAVVSITNLDESVAQFCSSVETGSPPVLT